MTVISKASAFPKSVQPGIPALGPKPVGWHRGPLSDHLFEQQRPVQMRNDAEYRLVTVKRSRGGVVARENLKGRQISVKSQFLLHPGDFLISKRQIVHGACGIVPAELEGSIASNEYAILRSKPTVDLNFLNYLAHSIYFQQTCFHSSIGVHVEKMIFKLDRWLSWDFDLPPVSEQRKIVEILCTWDRAIAAQGRLITNARAQKRALMQLLLTPKKRFPGFKGEWKKMSFDSVFKVENEKRTQVQKTLYQAKGATPIVDQGQDFIAGYTDHQNIFDSVPAIVFGDHTRVLKWVDFPFCPGADGTQILKTKSDVDLIFGYHLLTNADIPNLGYSRHMKALKELLFSVPADPLEQKKIASALSSCDFEIERQENIAKAHHQEKSALMQQLLTGKCRVKVKETTA